MTLEKIAKLSAGRKLDSLIEKVLFGGDGHSSTARYSKQAWVRVLDACPLVVGRMSPDEPNFKPEKPYFAKDRRLPAWIAATPGVAVCKAVLHMFSEYEPDRFADN